MPLYLRETNYSGGTNLNTTLTYAQLDGNFIYLDQRIDVSNTGSFLGNIIGTASYANNANNTISASYARTASAAYDFNVASELTLPGFFTSNYTFDGKSPFSINLPDGDFDFIINPNGFSGGAVSLVHTFSKNNDFITFGFPSSSRSGQMLATIADITSGSVYSASFATSSLSSSYALTASFVRIAQTASYVLNAVSASFASTASFVQTAQTASYWSGSINNALSSSYALTASYVAEGGGPIATTGSTLYSTNPSNGSNFSTTDAIFLGSGAGSGASNALRSNFLGYQAGYGASSANASNFIGYLAGYQATNANSSHFLGSNSGESATNANYSNFLGTNSGRYATNANYSNFLGANTGNSATNANYSNFLGNLAGSSATNASGSNFLGYYAGRAAVNAAYSTIMGYRAGYKISGNGVSSNNIIIGTNISLPDNTQDSINLGGIIFATGSYSTITGNPFTGSMVDGRVGIGKVSPQYTLDVSGSGYFSNGITSSLFGTASWALNVVGGAGSIGTSGRTLYSINPSNGSSFSTTDAIFFGLDAGNGASSADYSIFLGGNAGYFATNAYDSIFLGVNAGNNATNANNSNFFGLFAGNQAVNSSYSNFFGYGAGRAASSASFSTLIGYQAGYKTSGTGISSNNIIIGTNISLPNGTQDSINLGGLIFATGSYSTTAGNPFTNAVSNGRVGIGKVSPQYTLDVSGSGNFTNGLTVSSGSVTHQNGFTILAQVSQSLNFVDDTAAAAGGVPLGGLYRNGNFVLIRIS